MTYCEDYPCCGHTPSDPCDGVSYVTYSEYCDVCGFKHMPDQCPMDDEPDEDDYVDDDFPLYLEYPMEDQWLDGSYEM
jgi:hypothetical protein